MNSKGTKFKKKYAILIGLASLLLLTSIEIYCNNFISNTVKTNDLKETELTEVIPPKKSGFGVSSPIYIYEDNWTDLSGQPWFILGGGTSTSPHRIENVSIDATGYIYGIAIAYSDNYFEIRNCTIYNSEGWGIACDVMANGTIVNNTIYDNSIFGIGAQFSHNLIISDNTIENTQSGDGLYLWDCTNLTVSNNIIRNNAANGIYIDDDSAVAYMINNSIILNQIYDNDNNGIYIYIYAYDDHYFCDNNISQNQIHDNLGNGISIELEAWGGTNGAFCEGNIISNNKIYNNGFDGFGAGINIIAEIVFLDSHYLSFKGNQIVRNSISQTQTEGIFVQMLLSEDAESGALIDCGFNNISENRLENIGYDGIGLCGDTEVDAVGELYIYNNTIANNTIKNFDGAGGIALYSFEESDYTDVFLENSTVVNNKITKNTNAPNYLDMQAGIYLDRFTKTTISNNEMIRCGLFITPDTNYTMMKSNEIEDNKVNGKDLQYEIDLKNLNPSDFLGAGQIILVNCNHTKISQSKVSEATIGICLYSCRNVTISKVNSSNAWGGFGLFYCNYNNISNNRANNNAYFGIVLYYSNNNNITYNNFLGNRECIYEIASFNNRKENNQCPPTKGGVIPPSGDDDDDDGGKEQVISGYNLFLLFLFGLFVIIAISFKLTRKRINI